MRGIDALVVDGRDDVAIPQARDVRPGCRAVTAGTVPSAEAWMSAPWSMGRPICCARPAFRGMNRMPMKGRVSGSAVDGLLHDGLGDVDGDGEADALTTLGDRRVDADDIARGVDQRAAGVARVDGRVRLDEVAQRSWRQRAAGVVHHAGPGRGR